jgi:uncharacterized protein YaaW (UPF0174 family)
VDEKAEKFVVLMNEEFSPKLVEENLLSQLKENGKKFISEKGRNSIANVIIFLFYLFIFFYLL